MASVENNTLADYVRSSQNKDVRKMSFGSDGYSNMISEGDTKAFKSNDMGQDQFLYLLIAQLQHQDPLSPADDTQLVSQLAQFSQLEFTQNSTAAIASLASNMQAFMEMQTLQAQSITNSSATPLLGKDVRVMEASFQHEGLTSREFNVFLTEGNKSGMLVIKDSEGRVVAEISAGTDSTKGGETKVKWDGKDKEGNNVLGGNFTGEIVDAATGLKSVGYAYQDGTVTGVGFSAGGASMTINGKQYGLGYLVHVHNDSTTTVDAVNKLTKRIEEILGIEEEDDET
jgi:flagellar basal-body rod modification protein FlgD